ncbi:MAG TPA: hypothetical protein VE035_10345 [Puia sp.]|nr:hypothetical protein [Puia sp.]
MNRPATPKRPKGAFTYLVILLVAMGLIIYRMPCPSETQFIYLKVLLALVAGLFGWFLSGFIHLDYRVANLAIKAGGGGALFVLVLLFSPKLSSAAHQCDPDLNYTIILRDSLHQTINGLKGNLQVLIGNNVEKPEIQSTGVVDVKGITEDKENYSFNVELIAEGWTFQASHKKVLDTFFRGKRLVLPLVMDDAYCCVKGLVLDVSNNNHGLEGASVYIGGKKLITDKDGAFSYPVAPEERNSFLQCHIEKDSFIVSEKSVRPGNTIETIYLHKK